MVLATWQLMSRARHARYTGLAESHENRVDDAAAFIGGKVAECRWRDASYLFERLKKVLRAAIPEVKCKRLDLLATYTIQCDSDRNILAIGPDRHAILALKFTQQVGGRDVRTVS